MLVARVEKAYIYHALLKTASDDTIGLPRNSFHGIWKSDIKPGAEVVITELDKTTEGNYVAVVAFPPMLTGEMERQQTLIAESISAEDDTWDNSVAGKRSAEILAETDRALAWLKAQREAAHVAP